MGGRTSISEVLRDLLFSGKDVDAVVDEHLSPEYRHRIHGRWITRSEFRDQILTKRPSVTGGSVTVHHEVFGLDDRYAEWHTIELCTVGGAASRTEVFVFGAHAPDGRLLLLEERTVALPAVSQDRRDGTDAAS